MTLKELIDREATKELKSDIAHMLEVQADSGHSPSLALAYIDAKNFQIDNDCMTAASKKADLRIGIATGQLEFISDVQYDNISVTGGKARLYPKLDGKRTSVVMTDSDWADKWEGK